jgi:predicted Zn-dependent protease
MRTGLVANAVVLVGIAWLATLGASGVQSKSLLSATTTTKAVESSAMEALESAAVRSPSVESITALASLYVDHGQPGLACGAIERASRDIQLDPRVADVHARALFHRGRAREALAVAEDSLAACASEGRACRSWQVAKVRGEASFLQEVVSAGIDDPMENPAGVRAAYERSNERMGRVAMR